MARAAAAPPPPSGPDDHPRLTAQLLGHGAQQQAFLAAMTAGRLHHAWLLTGPRGIGKATMAWHCVRRLLAPTRPAILAESTGDDGASGLDFFGGPTGTLAADAGSLASAKSASGGSGGILDGRPEDRRIAALSHPDLRVLERPWDEKRKRRKGEISVDQVRGLAGFLHMTAGDSGRRVVLVDAIDDLNRNAANALLKLLEEPPTGVVLLLVSHNPGSLLPTIRSRCRRLAFSGLPADLAARIIAERRPGISVEDRNLLAQLADGAPGVAIDLADAGALSLYARIVAVIAGGGGRRDEGEGGTAALALADGVAGGDADTVFPTYCHLLLGIIERAALLGARHEAGEDRLAASEGAARQRLLQDFPPAELVERAAGLARLFAQCDAVNLDRRHVVLEAFSRLRRP